MSERDRREHVANMALVAKGSGIAGKPGSGRVLASLNDLDIEDMVRNPDYKQPPSHAAPQPTPGDVARHQKETAASVVSAAWTPEAVADLQATIVTRDTVLCASRARAKQIEQSEAREQILDLFSSTTRKDPRMNRAGAKGDGPTDGGPPVQKDVVPLGVEPSAGGS